MRLPAAACPLRRERTHAMEDEIDLDKALRKVDEAREARSEAWRVKARRVWEVAAVPKCGPLDDKAAEALGRDLEGAARWRVAAYSSPLPRIDNRIKQIETTARKLSSLI